LGGTLTNFNTIKRSIGRLSKSKRWSRRHHQRLRQQEQSVIPPRGARLVKFFRCIGRWTNILAHVRRRYKREHNAVAEKLGG